MPNHMRSRLYSKDQLTAMKDGSVVVARDLSAIISFGRKFKKSMGSWQLLNEDGAPGFRSYSGNKLFSSYDVIEVDYEA